MKALIRKSLKALLNQGQLRLTLAFFVICGLGLFGSNFYLVNRGIDQVVISTAHILTQNLSAPLMFQDRKTAGDLLKSLETHPVLRGGIVLDAKGGVFESYAANMDGGIRGDRGPYYEFPIQAQSDRIGSLMLFVRSDVKRTWLMVYVYVGAAILLIGLAVAQFFARATALTISGQLRTFLEVVRKITHSEQYSHRILERHSEELTIEEVFSLASEFDAMLGVVENRNEKINEINQGLEKKVEEKTSELREAQAGLVQSGKLSALGEMAASLAHEVNNPLTVILAKSHLIVTMSEKANIDPEAVKKLALSIESMGSRISKIIKGLRSFSRDGSRDPFETCKLKSIIDDAMELCAIRFKNAGIRFECSGIDDEMLISCRATELGQVILNLLNNAHDAIASLEEKWIVLNVSRDGGNFVVNLTDSGKGIPDSIRKKIMQPFFTTKAVGKGTGLGLSISKGIIEGHGGTLTIDEKCPNTRFVICLPNSSSQSSPPATPRAA